MPTSKTKENFWFQHIRTWSSSQLSQVAYCQQKRLTHHQFTYWKNKFDKKVKKVVPPKSPGFAHVTLHACPAAEGLHLTFPSGVKLSGIQSTNLITVKDLIGLLK